MSSRSLMTGTYTFITYVLSCWNGGRVSRNRSTMSGRSMTPGGFTTHLPGVMTSPLGSSDGGTCQLINRGRIFLPRVDAIVFVLVSACLPLDERMADEAEQEIHNHDQSEKDEQAVPDSHCNRRGAKFRDEPSPDPPDCQHADSNHQHEQELMNHSLTAQFRQHWGKQVFHSRETIVPPASFGNGLFRSDLAVHNGLVFHVLAIQAFILLSSRDVSGVASGPCRQLSDPLALIPCPEQGNSHVVVDQRVSVFGDFGCMLRCERGGIRRLVRLSRVQRVHHADRDQSDHCSDSSPRAYFSGGHSCVSFARWINSSALPVRRTPSAVCGDMATEPRNQPS